MNIKIENHKKLTLIETKQSNTPTIQANVYNKTFYIHSKYDPLREAVAFAEKYFSEDVEDYIIYGLGLAYHIKELEKLIIKSGMNYHIYIIECNRDVFKIAKENGNLHEILDNDNITLFLMGNDKESYEKLNYILSIKNIKVIIHNPSLNIVPKEFIDLKYLFEEFQVKENTIELNKGILDYNFKYNIKNYNENVDVLFNKHINKPLYLISAGPSMDKNIHELSNVKGNGIILSVGRAVRPLLLAGIIPDYIIITDPSDFLYDMQLRGLCIDVPIIVLSTCDRNVMANYRGFKYIALQEGYEPAEEYAKSKNYKLVETGGSVATTGLDIAIKMGCNPIVFVGQDLAFTDDKTHSRDNFDEEIISIDGLRVVEDIYGNQITTSKNLSIYLRWIQNRIAKEKNIEFIDATEGGTRIKGARIMGLNKVISQI